MPGLLTKNDDILRQWKHLLETRDNFDSLKVRRHWHEVLRLGFPEQTQEEWKYIPLDWLLDQKFVLPNPITLSLKIIIDHALPIDALRLVFVDGRFSSELSDVDRDPFTVHVIPSRFQETMFSNPIHPEFFLHFTESFADQVTFIHLADGKKTTRPLYLLHITTGNDSSHCITSDKLYTSGYRCHLQQDSSTDVVVIEHFITINSSSYFTVARFTANIGNNAKFKHYYFSFEDSIGYHFSHNDFSVGSNTHAESHNFLLGSRLTRHQTSVKLHGDNSRLILNSLMIPIGTEVFENRTWLEHANASCNSQQLHKTIVYDCAKAVFNGILKVSLHAPKTCAQMNNKNLLLGPAAEVDTRPQLEIYHDDVKCGHGATIACINEEQIFYLRTRGIEKSIAQRMIIDAFSSEVTECLSNSLLKEAVQKRITDRVGG
ncbi:Fe-S cluster assembly protein SufD [Candidatus Erwinia haradaeae]|uniref:FeS cluster assembly protein SufD n=1 Tax=Candidatus Erwinia haradaeae TaxID=1922217 RepID=A0A451DNM8_9GAMM|nr:Fe-S cluster assembly protein SufD [Candidatus Erwinia haradaeae]VFP88372.1 FeS cluster assembly protein SufD [Candidatus Erwinia haradaeae]